MAHGWYLLDNPPARSQGRTPRREQPSGVCVVHSAENVPDVNPPDTGAEAVAGFIRRRSDPGSYHTLCDSDTSVRLLPPWWEAWQDATGSNRHAWSVSGAFRAHQWTSLPQRWRDACVARMAAEARWYAAWLLAERGIVIPARRITRAESERRIPGFIPHADRDPARRSDPGPDFPWGQFLALYADGQEDDDMIRPGATGPTVKFWQVALRDVGHDPGPADGQYGPSTQAAVRAFQTSLGVGNDGVLDASTLALLAARARVSGGSHTHPSGGDAIRPGDTVRIVRP